MKDSAPSVAPIIKGDKFSKDPCPVIYWNESIYKVFCMHLQYAD
jgi:hypothetical protein